MGVGWGQQFGGLFGGEGFAAVFDGDGDSSTISRPKPSRAGMCMGVFESRRMRWMPRSERIWPPRPMARRMRPVRAWSLRARGVPGEGRCGRWGTRSARRKARRRGRRRGGSVIDFVAARGVVQVEEDSAALGGDQAHGFVKDFAAVAVGGEDVAGRAAGVHADQHGRAQGGRQRLSGEEPGRSRQGAGEWPAW